jgi:hypothetical protein
MAVTPPSVMATLSFKSQISRISQIKFSARRGDERGLQPEARNNPQLDVSIGPCSKRHFEYKESC